MFLLTRTNILGFTIRQDYKKYYIIGDIHAELEKTMLKLENKNKQMDTGSDSLITG